METIDFNQVLTDNISVVEGLLHYPLSSAVGTTNGKAVDANTLTNGMYGVFYTTQEMNYPTVAGYGVLICFGIRSSNSRLQIYAENNGRIFMRVDWGEWSQWKQIPFN